ncbi:MAG TPA: magnesium/cobalt transporter CorA [Dongiaceae bacterium]|nr:magnesium/cobalt transporter CorA [Dongiaceae bacterium]
MNHVVNCALYQGGRKIRDIDINDTEHMKVSAGQLIWIGLLEPTHDLLLPLQHLFGLHELAIEDAYRAHQRPKLEVYGDTVFVAMKTCQWLDNCLALGETSFFVGRGYIISVRHGKSLSYTAVRDRCEHAPDKLKHGEDFILYALMDFIVDNYFPVIDALEEKVEELEEAIFAGKDQSRDVLGEIALLRRDLLDMRHAVAPLPDICQRIMRYDVPAMDKGTQPYFRDIYDHSNILMDRIEALRETVKSVVESKMLMESMRQNDVMRRLAAWAAMLAVPTMVAGIYGMNFDIMPELKWHYGYIYALLLMAGICSFLYWRFKKSGWL